MPSCARCARPSRVATDTSTPHPSSGTARHRSGSQRCSRVRDVIVVAGAVAQKPRQAGHAWQFLQYLLGFRRLGWDVLFVDRLDGETRVQANIDWFAHVMRAAGLADSCALLADGVSIFGVSRERVLEQTRRSALLLNVMGYLDDEEVLGAAPKRVFLDTDPGFGQMWLELGLADIFRGHDVHVTVAENIGRDDCTIP